MDKVPVRLNWWSRAPNNLNQRLTEKVLFAIRATISTSLILLSGWITYVVVVHAELKDVPLLSLMASSWVLTMLAWVIK